MSWLADNLGLILSLSLVHIQESVIPIVLSFVIAVPLGWVAWRYRLLRGPVLVITGILYTIPSLALLSLLPVMIGTSYIDPVNLMVALTIYGVALMTRAVADGLDSVDPDVRMSSVAMGYGGARRFWGVDLPLAGPVILAGLRVTAASTVALATVGILIGVTNLGYLFTNGLQREILVEVFSGVVAVLIIATLIDLVLVVLGRLLLPWERVMRAGRGRRRVRLVLDEGVAA